VKRNLEREAEGGSVWNVMFWKKREPAELPPGKEPNHGKGKSVDIRPRHTGGTAEGKGAKTAGIAK